MTKKLILLMLCMSLMLGCGVIASADVEYTNSPTETVLVEYLTALKNGDYEMASNLVIDTRMQAQDLCEFYQNIAQDSEEAIFDFTNPKLISDADAFALYESQVTFKDGHEKSLEFQIYNINNEFKVVITPSSNNQDMANDYTVTKVEMTDDAPSSIISTQSSAMLDDWSFTGLWSTKYGLDEFTITSNTVYLYVDQWAQSPPAYIPTVKYAIVKEGFWGDTVWGQANISGVGYSEATITKSSSVTNPFTAKIRISRMNGDDYSFVNGYGSLYQ